MYQQLREEFPEIKNKIRASQFLIKKKYRYRLQMTHPFSKFIGDALRGVDNKNVQLLKSDTELPGNVRHWNGIFYSMELARQIYRRIMEKLPPDADGHRPDVRAVYGEVVIYCTTIEQARDWLSWITQVNKEYTPFTATKPKQFYPFLDLVTALRADVEPDEILRTQARYKNMKFYVKLRAYTFKDGSNLRLHSLLTSDTESILPTGRLSVVDRLLYLSGGEGFYCTTGEIVTFIQLSFPGMIKKIYRVRYMESTIEPVEENF